MRRSSLVTLLAILLVPLGLASLWVSYGPGRVAEFTPWLVTGWTCAACALGARRIAPWSLEWALLMAVAVTWLLPDVSSCLNVEPISHRCVSLNVAPALANTISWLWLGVLAHAVVTFPSGRVTSPPVFLLTVAAYFLAIATGFGVAVAAPILASLLIATPLVSSLVGRDRDPAAWIASTLAGGAVAAALLLDPSSPYGFEVGIAIASSVLFAGLATIARRRRALTADRAVELGPALADVLNDPAFRIAVRAPHGDGWLTTYGVPAPEPQNDGLSETTAIVRDGVEIARVTHNGATLNDPAIREAVIRAVELEAHNARLRADLADQADSLVSSRRRLLDAGLREREALGGRVQTDVMLRLGHIAEAARSVQTNGLPTRAADHLRLAVDTLDMARAEIEDLARGVYPPALVKGGLVGALHDLAGNASTNVRVEAPEDVSGGKEVDATLYFLCAEALANAARHARASSVGIVVERSDAEVKVVIEDDGIGGADEDRGTGLRGLRDRVEALGGRLDIQSEPDKGTRLVATVPVAYEAR